MTSLYFNPASESQDGFWHKDKIGEEADVSRIKETGAGLQMQIALVPSDDLELVPGSHLRDYSPEEHAICVADGEIHNRSNDMPGAVRPPPRTRRRGGVHPVVHSSRPLSHGQAQTHDDDLGEKTSRRPVLDPPPGTGLRLRPAVVPDAAILEWRERACPGVLSGIRRFLLPTLAEPAHGSVEVLEFAAEA